MSSRAQALRVGVSFRNAVNPSVEAAGETSLFRTLRNETPPATPAPVTLVAFMNDRGLREVASPLRALRDL
jgi:hypothetical protein